MHRRPSHSFRLLPCIAPSHSDSLEFLLLLSWLCTCVCFYVLCVYQMRITDWMSTARGEIQKWVELEAELVKAKRDAGDVIENQAMRQRELDKTLLRNKAWQRARRRDARDKLLSATAGALALGDGDD